MNDSDNTIVLKPIYYDAFKCIADQCTYSCCCDWNIEIDPAAYERYQSMESIDSGCFQQEDNRILIRHNEDGRCVFLDSAGLCTLVLAYGDSVLSDTCTHFPRTYIKRENGVEESVSNSCPVVLKQFLTLPSPLSYVMEEGEEPGIFHGCAQEAWIPYRDRMIDLLQIENMELWKRQFLLHQFAGKIDRDEGNAMQCCEQYADPSYLNQISHMLDSMNVPSVPRLQLLARIFEYINENSRHMLGYKRYICQLLPQLEHPDWEQWSILWESFSHRLEDYTVFFEHLCVNSIFRDGAVDRGRHSLLNKSIELILEQAVIRFTLFLQWILHEHQISDSDLVEITCYYARIIEHNAEKFYSFIHELENAGLLSEANLFLLLR